MRMMPMSPPMEFLGSLAAAVFLIAVGVRLVAEPSLSILRLFRIGYEEKRGTIVAMPVELRYFGGGNRRGIHAYAVQPVVSIDFDPTRTTMHPDNNYRTRGLGSRESALAYSLEIGKIGDEVVFLVNKDGSDSFFPIGQDRVLVPASLELLMIGCCFLIPVCLIFNCGRKLYNLPSALRERRSERVRQQELADVVRRRRRGDVLGSEWSRR